MKVAITAGGENLNSPVDRAFGRTKWFVITDPDGGNVEVLENSQNVNAAQGAGIQAAQHIGIGQIVLDLMFSLFERATRK